MNEGYALRHLRKLMGWSFEEDNRETNWLRMMSDFKYDSYRDFWAGARFVESLLGWLQQFAPEHRRQAYALVREKLIFLSFTEIEHLVSRTRPVFVHDVLLDRVAGKSNVAKYLIWSKAETQKLYADLLQRTLFVGLSDGARVDGFRRANDGLISNEQVALGYDLSHEKWRDMHEELKARTKDPGARFEVLFLIDDFTGSGKSLIRMENGTWKGKLKKLAVSFRCHPKLFAQDCVVRAHHYIGTEGAKSAITALLAQATGPSGPKVWFPNPVGISFDLILKKELTLSRGQNEQLDELLDRYYDARVETKSIKVGGTDVKFGFAACGLPLILEHNTPNNSVGLLWAESSSPPAAPGHTMRPLFRRAQRHT
ncbi:MAG: hypothetical protein Q8N18_18890 [Opitutaceae bacterium]|nr:hypothetical protein [Opitutaceae bacterium]